MAPLNISTPLVSSEAADMLSPDHLESVDGRVRTALMLIQNEGYSRASIERIAALVNLSVTRLNHLFKEYIGTSPRNYDVQLRLLKAEELIRHTYLRIKEIEAKCGFTDSSRFALQFRRAFGITPKECRARALRSQTTREVRSNSSIGIANSAQK